MVIDRLLELADRRFQQRVWLASSGPEVSSFAEAICGLFNDSGLIIPLEKGECAFTEEIDRMLRRLGAMAHALDELQSPADLIRHSHMERIRKLSIRILSLVCSSPPPIRSYTDFNSRDLVENKVFLNATYFLPDVQAQGQTTADGMRVILYDEELEVSATIHFDKTYDCWVANADWNTIHYFQ